jgi:hypothetical protein
VSTSIDDLVLTLRLIDESRAERKRAEVELKRVREELEKVTKAEGEQSEAAQKLAEKTRQLTASVDKARKSQLQQEAASRKTRRELAAQERQVEQARSAWSRLGDAMKSPLVAGATVAGLAYFTRSAVLKFSSVQDAASALQATFGETGDAMIAWAKRSGDALNLTQDEALNSLQRFAGVARVVGKTGSELAVFSQNLVERAAEMASYYGGSTQDALEAIAAGLRGEADPLERYNVFLSDAAMKQELFVKTGRKVSGTLTAQQRVMAAYSILMRQTDVAAGDIARTQDSMANTIKDAEQQWGDFQTTVGATAATVVGPLLGGLNDLLGVVNGLPGPVLAVVLGLTAFGAILLVVIPRVIQLRAHMAQAGVTAGGLAKGFGRAAAGVGLATTAIAFFASAQANAQSAAEGLRTTLDETTDAATELTRQKIGESVLFNFTREDLAKTPFTLREIIDAAIKGGEAYDDLRSRMNAWWESGSAWDKMAWSEHTRLYNALQNTASAARNDAQSAYDLAAATRDAGSAAQTAAVHTNVLADAESRYTAAVAGLPGALDRVDRLLARRSAKRAYTAALETMAKKPTKENSDAAAAAYTAYVRTFKKPENGMKAAEDALDQFNQRMRNSSVDPSLRKYFKDTIQDVRDFITETHSAQTAFGSLKASLAAEASRRAGDSNPYNGNGKWMGGRVYGPGTSTSDSILTPLSNGEYVLRAAAANALGDSILGRLNHWDRLGSTDRAPIARKLAAATPPAPRVMPGRGAAQGASVRGGDVIVTAHIEKGVDWRAEMDAWDRMRQANLELTP